MFTAYKTFERNTGTHVNIHGYSGLELHA